MSYDTQNVFARILRGEVPSRRMHEDTHTLAFADIRAQAPVHTLVIPKGPYVSWDDFSERASDAEIVAWVRSVGHVARTQGVASTGYRVVTNNGPHSHQEVPHFHAHILGGRPLGRLVNPSE